VAVLIQAFVVKPYRIPSKSMYGTLRINDRVLVDRLAYRLGDIKRGDVVVFRWPLDRKITFIKRVIGLPGDALALDSGRVFVNGSPLSEPYVVKSHGRAAPTLAGAVAVPAGAAPWSLQHAYTVPAGHFFMMGDNRTLSDDSRDWGCVPRGDIIGKAMLIYWPPGRLGGL
jgi:signal peptidase I